MYESTIFPFRVIVCNCCETHEETGINLTLDDRRIGRDTSLIEYGTFSNMAVNIKDSDDEEGIDIKRIN